MNGSQIAVSHTTLPDGVQPAGNCIEGAFVLGMQYIYGEWIKPTLPPKSPEQIKNEITQAVQTRLDTFAQTRNYDSILSACTYASSTVAQFASEGQLCVNLRDATWGKLYQIMQEVTDGTRPMPAGYADIEAELPALAWA